MDIVDRRRTYRFNLRYLVFSEGVVIGRTYNVSRHGIFFNTTKPCQLQEVLDLKVGDTRFVMYIHGRVVRVQSLSEKVEYYGVALTGKIQILNSVVFTRA
jgi:hypothetical protein